MLASPVTIQARQILDIVYPVGMVLMFSNGTNPNNIMHGQTWTKLTGGYALTTTNNTNGGDNSVTDAQNHKPGSTYQGGLPNIEGTLEFIRGAINADRGQSGALYGSSSYKAWGGEYGSGNDHLHFDASRHSDRYGMYQGSKVSVVADHYAVVAWKRTG